MTVYSWVFWVFLNVRFQNIPGLDGLSKGISFTQRWKISVCWKFQVIAIKKTCHGLDSYYKSSTAKQSIEFRPSSSKSNNISNDKLTPQKQLSKHLFQSCPEISVNQLNIKTPHVEIFSEHQRSKNVSQTKENLSIDTNIKASC